MHQSAGHNTRRLSNTSSCNAVIVSVAIWLLQTDLTPLCVLHGCMTNHHGQAEQRHPGAGITGPSVLHCHHRRYVCRQVVELLLRRERITSARKATLMRLIKQRVTRIKVLPVGPLSATALLSTDVLSCCSQGCRQPGLTLDYALPSLTYAWCRGNPKAGG